jgi:hypothetical protein
MTDTLQADACWCTRHLQHIFPQPSAFHANLSCKKVPSQCAGFL